MGPLRNFIVLCFFFCRNIEVNIPSKTRQNGTLFLHVILTSDNGQVEWKNLQRDGPTVIQRVALTDYMIPKAATFNLLGDAVRTFSIDYIVSVHRSNDILMTQ